MASGVVVFTFDETTEGGSGVQQVQEEWSEEHAKLLYMISRYARCAENADEYEGFHELFGKCVELCVHGELREPHEGDAALSMRTAPAEQGPSRG